MTTERPIVACSTGTLTVLLGLKGFEGTAIFENLMAAASVAALLIVFRAARTRGRYRMRRVLICLLWPIGQADYRTGAGNKAGYGRTLYGFEKSGNWNEASASAMPKIS